MLYVDSACIFIQKFCSVCVLPNCLNHNSHCSYIFDIRYFLFTYYDSLKYSLPISSNIEGFSHLFYSLLITLNGIFLSFIADDRSGLLSFDEEIEESVKRSPDEAACEHFIHGAWDKDDGDAHVSASPFSPCDVWNGEQS